MTYQQVKQTVPARVVCRAEGVQFAKRLLGNARAGGQDQIRSRVDSCRDKKGVGAALCGCPVGFRGASDRA